MADVVKASDGNLAKQLAEHMKQTGKLSSANVQAAIQDQEEKPGAKTEQALQQSTTLTSDQLKTDDPLIAAAEGGVAGDALKDMEAIKKLKREQVVITPDDKEAFIDALVSGKRLVLYFMRCGKRINVAIRSRTVPETQAILQQLKREIDAGTIVTQTDYTTRLRAMMMAAQVVDCNGTHGDPLKEPLFQMVGTDGKLVDPAWLGQAQYWNGVSDGLQAVVWSCLQEFEDKYWIMVDDARDANFWSPAAST